MSMTTMRDARAAGIKAIVAAKMDVRLGHQR